MMRNTTLLFANSKREMYTKYVNSPNKTFPQPLNITQTIYKTHKSYYSSKLYV